MSSSLREWSGSYLWYIFFFDVIPNRLKCCRVHFVHSSQESLYKPKTIFTFRFVQLHRTDDDSSVFWGEKTQKEMFYLSFCFCEWTIWIWVELRMGEKISHWDTEINKIHHSRSYSNNSICLHQSINEVTDKKTKTTTNTLITEVNGINI